MSFSARLADTWLSPSTVWLEQTTSSLVMLTSEQLQQSTPKFWILLSLAAVAFGLVYYYLYLPVNIVKDLSQVGFDFVYDGSFKSTVNKGKSKKQLVNDLQKLRKSGEVPPPYPNGWYTLLESKDLKPNQVKYVAAIGENFAVFRTEEGVVRIIDAYCPHLGANMAVGGVVRGNCLECPFHKWSFHGETGKCSNIPYAEKIPEVAKVKTWTSKECNELIFVWYNAENEEPSWYPEQAEVVSKWNCHGRAEYFVNSHIQDVPENGGDVAHLNAIHQPSVFAGADLRYYEKFLWQFMDHKWSATWAQSEQHKHIGVMDLNHTARIFGKYSLLTMKVKAVQIGPAYVELYMESAIGPLLLLMTVTPVEPLLQRVLHKIYAPSYLSLFAKFSIAAECKMFERDVMVWNNKKYVDKPIIVKEDKVLAKHRRWFSQFYSENSVKFTHVKNTLNW